MKKLEIALWGIAMTWATLALWPASFWYDAGKMEVEPAVVGHPLVLDYTGGVRREFKGSYTVVIRRTSDGVIVSEDRSGVFVYTPHSTRPEPLTFGWWSPRGTLPLAGTYYVKTCWTIHQPFWGVVPNKSVCTEPSIFRIRGV